MALVKKRLFFATFILLVSIGIVFSLNYWGTRYKIRQWHYDFSNPNKPIKNKEEIDKILTSFESIPYDELDEAYMNYSRSGVGKYKKMLSGSRYYVIPKNKVSQRIVGRFRIREFLCKDKYFKNEGYQDILWLINPEVLYKTQELIDLLEGKGYDKEAFDIRSSHRHPAYNERIKGAGSSRHIMGEAVDIVVKDINQDGQYTSEDKKIVLDLLDQEIIKDKGGLGLYPNSRSVHYDVRGFRARWNSY
jgi:hypothetical protein